MLKKSLLLSTLFTLSPIIFAEEQTTEEQVVDSQNTSQEVTKWTFACTFKAKQFTQNDWDYAVERLTTTVNTLNEENSNVNAIEETLALLKEFFALSSHSDEFIPADSDKTILISFEANKLNNDDAESWKTVRAIIQEASQNLEKIGQNEFFEAFATCIRNVTNIIQGSSSLNGNIFMGFTPTEEQVVATNPEEEVIVETETTAE